MAEVANAANAELGDVAGQEWGEDQALPLNSGTKTEILFFFKKNSVSMLFVLYLLFSLCCHG